jgi:hypothetical protein
MENEIIFNIFCLAKDEKSGRKKIKDFINFYLVFFFETTFCSLDEEKVSKFFSKFCQRIKFLNLLILFWTREVR